MKFLTVFVALLSVAFGYQATWTLPQLDQAISNPATDPHLIPYLEQALNEIMAAMFAGQQVTAVTVTIPAVDLSSWSLTQLSDALQNPTTDPALVPYLEQALNQMMDAIVAGMPVGSAPVVVPAMEISYWTLPELSAALTDPSTDPALLPYLEHALNEIMSALFAGQQIDAIVVAVPIDAIPVENPVAPVPVETPVVPVETPVATPVSPAAPSSPLVQIIVNVNPQAAPAPPAAPAAPVAPSPVVEAEKPQPVIVVEEAAPQPIGVNPVDVIAITPPQVNPVDVIAVAAPEVLPVIVGTPVIVGAPVVGPMY